MARTQAISMLKAAGEKGDLKEIYGIVIDNIQKDTLSKEYCASHYITFDTIYDIVLTDIQRNLVQYRFDSERFREFLNSKWQPLKTPYKNKNPTRIRSGS